MPLLLLHALSACLRLVARTNLDATLSKDHQRKPNRRWRDLRSMCETGGGSIVNIASIGGKGYRKTANAAYAASKGAVLALTRVAAIQLAPYGIRVNAVCPGPTGSPMLNAHDTPETRGRVEDMIADIPLKRLSTPDEIAAAVEYLATACNVTGQSMNVDGGLG